LVALVDSSLDFWLTAGRYHDKFETELAKFVGVKKALMVNSGSSANLVALSSLSSPLMGSKRLKAGDEVITCATSFPTTVNPILQTGATPVFLDAETGTYNMDVSRLEEALTDKTRAVMIAHTLGNPFDLDAILSFCKKHDLFLVEDCCDALGATWDGKKVGTFGHVSTLSFYPAHHITTGEGGAVMTSDARLSRAAESMRDWGRDCWCAPGKDNTCGKRFGWKMGELPFGYDHKYIYSHIGYNLKATDMQAAVGGEQLKNADAFITARRKNHAYLLKALTPLSDVFILPRHLPKANPSPFGFVLTMRPDAPFTKNEIVAHLEAARISTRQVFAGNITRQPAYKGAKYRVVGELTNSDLIMNNTFWIGVYPGLTPNQVEFMVEKIEKFVKSKRK
ncbi:MAG: lipopolysaccharide biosynthesis protein RfbH, partial [Deltaproteobacteria bacterium]